MVKELVLSSLLHLVRPIVRLCLKHGIKLGEVVDALKRVYVSQAEELLEKQGDAVSHSRITLMTGVHRTDVATIRTEGDFKPRQKHTASDVISQWRYDPRFCASPGMPRALTFDSKESEFAELVRSVSHSVSPYTVAFELERLGMLARARDGRLKLLTRVYVPKGDPGAVLEMLGEDADDLFLAVEQNAFRSDEEQPLNHHLKTEYRNVPAEALEEIRRWSMREGSAFHERARNFLSKFDRDLNPQLGGTGTYRVAIGSFAVIEETPVTTTASKDQDDQERGSRP
jgi:hypothetical protein